jgi:hypothetical protein
LGGWVVVVVVVVVVVAQTLEILLGLWSGEGAAREALCGFSGVLNGSRSGWEGGRQGPGR